MRNVWQKITKSVFFIALFLFACFLFETVSAEEVKAQDVVITANPITEVRALPSPDAQLLGTLGPGVYLARYEARPDGWSLIDYAGTPAYILTQAMTVYGAAPAAAAPANGVAAPASAAKSGITVYITATGTKYHTKANCGRNKTAIPIAIEDAKAKGYTPCKKCCK